MKFFLVRLLEYIINPLILLLVSTWDADKFLAALGVAVDLTNAAKDDR